LHSLHAEVERDPQFRETKKPPGNGTAFS